MIIEEYGGKFNEALLANLNNVYELNLKNRLIYSISFYKEEKNISVVKRIITTKR